ncbi:hypothetical protein Afil01_22830 [Actinorhabdospora filicis]|uniref:HTTM-like domain-containing protein n=1 Tax=Actinorhabdospora filicis TaxID=1785913 RepID=A0A9W6SKN0_9ACTN|nr:hypothetical protein [Actinorhabdospora filicis]GLZ77476.1 hypothetical protein Afil01_22830 [Actinorhabdospora filicis]
MSLIARVWRSVEGPLIDFDPRTTPMALGRSGLGLASLILLLANPDHVLFAPTPRAPSGISCSGPGSVALWCLSEAAAVSPVVPRSIAVVVLVLVVVGYRPRWTAVPHWYVAFSLATGLSMPNGGENVVQVVSMLLVPICLSDDRAWHWVSPSTPLPGRARGAAYAAFLGLRAQTSIIYLSTAISKLTNADWRSGTAMTVIVHDPMLGFPQAVTSRLESLSWWPMLAAVITWGTVLAEGAIALLLWGTRRSRLVAFGAGTGLHLGILALMGIAGFELAMLSLLILVILGHRAPSRPPKKSRSHPEAKVSGNAV